MTKIPQFSGFFELCRSSSPGEKKKRQGCQHDNNFLLMHSQCQILRVLKQGESVFENRERHQAQSLFAENAFVQTLQ